MSISALIFRLPARNYHGSSVFAGSPQNSQGHSTIAPIWEYIGPEKDFIGGLFTMETIRSAIPFGTFDGATFRSRINGRKYKLICGMFRLEGSKHFNAAIRRTEKETECHQAH